MPILTIVHGSTRKEGSTLAYSYYNVGISSLFTSTSNSSSSTQSMDLYKSFGEFSSIRNGSYRKLVAAKIKNDALNAGSSSTSSSTDALFDGQDKNLSTIKKDADSVKDAANPLLTKGKDSVFRKKETKVTDKETGKTETVLDYDREKISAGIKNFTNEYNDFVTSVQKASDTGTLKKAVTMVGNTKSWKKSLEKIGVMIGKDNKLTVDNEVLNKASVTDIMSVFNGRNSYADTIATRANEIGQAMVKQVANSGAYSFSCYA